MNIPATTTELVVSGSTDTADWVYMPYEYPYTYPWPFTAPTITYWPIAAAECSGNAHVWACDHARTCKCGKATRPVECPHCGKIAGA